MPAFPPTFDDDLSTVTSTPTTPSVLSEVGEEENLLHPSSVGRSPLHITPADPTMDLLGPAAIQALMHPELAQRARNVL